MERQPMGAGPEPTGTEHQEKHDEQAEGLRRERPRIYVASLSDYNAGVLHGEWIDADQDLSEVYEAVEHMLQHSPTDRHAEEFAVHDYEGFGAIGIGEYESLEWINSVANGITEHGPAFAAWARHCDLDEERLEHFEEAYLGEWNSLTAYAEEMLDDLGYTQTIEQAIPESMQPYITIDYGQFAHDLQLSGDVSAVERPDGGIWLFQTEV